MSIFTVSIWSKTDHPTRISEVSGIAKTHQQCCLKILDVLQTHIKDVDDVSEIACAKSFITNVDLAELAFNGLTHHSSDDEEIVKTVIDEYMGDVYVKFEIHNMNELKRRAEKIQEKLTEVRTLRVKLENLGDKMKC